MAEERNIRNTQYSVQLPVVTSKEFENLVPELGAMVFVPEYNKLCIGAGDHWKFIEL